MVVPGTTGIELDELDELDEDEISLLDEEDSGLEDEVSFTDEEAGFDDDVGTLDEAVGKSSKKWLSKDTSCIGCSTTNVSKRAKVEYPAKTTPNTNGNSNFLIMITYLS